MHSLAPQPLLVNNPLVCSFPLGNHAGGIITYDHTLPPCMSTRSMFGRSLSGFLENHKGVAMFQNCLQNEKGDVFPRSTLG